MHTTILLLGRPRIDRPDGPAPTLRGSKTWALLAALILARRPLSREWAAETFFGSADDPRAALRWAVAELRRKLADAVTIEGDPLVLRLAETTSVDVLDTAPANAPGRLIAGRLPLLLEGVELHDPVEAELWLTRSREACRRAAVAGLTQAAETSLVEGVAVEAVLAARALVEDDPLDEARHLLLVRALAASGDRPGARAAAQRCDEILLHETGVAASPVLMAAASVPFGAPVALVDRDAILGRTLMEAARSAMASGAVQVGLAHFADAEAAAHRSRDDLLLSEVLFARGSAVVHAVASTDPQALQDLRRSADLAIAGGRAARAAPALRELAFARASARQPLEGLVERAAELASDDAAEQAAILGIRGFEAVDDGRYAVALADFTSSIQVAESVGAGRQMAWSWTLRGRTHLQRGELAAAAADLEGAAALVHELRWTAFVPFVQAQQGLLALHEGRVDDAANLVASGWTTARVTGDQCWLSLLGQVAGLVAARRGELDEAMTVLAGAYSGQATTVDRCRWIDAVVLDALISVAVQADPPRAVRAAARLAEVAARDRMPEYAVRAAAWQLRLGDADARDRALAAIRAVDNPSLAGLLTP
ncbi:MAG: BTAD domain-containing putative transcriptional regulator [Actinomycetota bacterium]